MAQPQHEGMHNFYMPAEDAGNDRIPDIDRCIKETDVGRCTFRRPPAEVAADRANQHAQRVAEADNRRLVSERVEKSARQARATRGKEIMEEMKERIAERSKKT